VCWLKLQRGGHCSNLRAHAHLHHVHECVLMVTHRVLMVPTCSTPPHPTPLHRCLPASVHTSTQH
jgi:hypothetical protein